ncbi:hypothetical protein QUA42_12430 [Microcoleus sp. Pol11C2]
MSTATSCATTVLASAQILFKAEAALLRTFELESFSKTISCGSAV